MICPSPRPGARLAVPPGIAARSCVRGRWRLFAVGAGPMLALAAPSTARRRRVAPTNASLADAVNGRRDRLAEDDRVVGEAGQRPTCLHVDFKLKPNEGLDSWMT